MIYNLRHKLKQEYAALSGNEIKNLRLSGVEVCLCRHFERASFTVRTSEIFVVDSHLLGMTGYILNHIA